MAQLHQAESVDVRAERNEQRLLEQRKVQRYSVSRRRVNDQQVHRSFTSTNSFLA